MASEDSDEFMSGLAMVHRLGDLHDLEQTARREMASVVDHPHHLGELLEVVALRRPQRMLLEERNDRSDEILAALHDVPDQVFAMVVVAPILVDPAYSEERMKLLEAGAATRTLHHNKSMNDLVAESVGASATPAALADESDSRSILLRLQTRSPSHRTRSAFPADCPHRRIVTAQDRSLGLVPDGYTGFPAFGRMRTAPLPARGAAIVFVTLGPFLCVTGQTLLVPFPAGVPLPPASRSPVRADHLISPSFPAESLAYGL
jgi:hypothetical protein